MRTIITFALLLLAELIHAQCTYEDLFPVEHGISKFKAITKIASQTNMKEDTLANQSSPARWDKPDYLNGDSVYKTSVYYDYVFHPCFKGNENKLHLKFIDDKL